MKKQLLTFFLCGLACFAKAQKPITTEPYGKVSQADLELQDCDFEKGANAEVLFDKGDIHLGDVKGLVMVRHTRIKIFNDFGKSEGNIRVEVYGQIFSNAVNDLEAETINLVNGKIEITPIDKKVVYFEKVDKYRTAMIFALPNVKAGSIIEYKYKLSLSYGNWYFQGSLPTKYSEIKMDLPASTAAYTIKLIPHVKQPFLINIGAPDDLEQTKALENIHSLPDEPYMGARQDNLQRLEYSVTIMQLNTWDKIGKLFMKLDDFGDQLDKNITGESKIIEQAKTLKTDNEKIAFIFDTVKNSMKWDELNEYFTIDGTVRAWDKKVGNSAEINIIVYDLLKKAKIKAYPMVVSTVKNGRINPINPGINLFNKMVVFVPVDSTQYYLLDATDKANLFNTIPTDELNTYGLYMNEHDNFYTTIFIQNTQPAMQAVFLNAEIKANGKMDGTAEITSYSYNKTNALKKHNADGEEKYIDYLRNNDNAVKISSFKLENMKVDSLPLTQKFSFSSELTGSDENYIYFSTNLFNLMGENPFTSETRYSDIDFGYFDNYSINGIYKLPEGYKAEALPKNITIVMPDQSIIFKRVIVQEDRTISVRYVLMHKKTLYFTQNYQDLRGFYKQLYELLNEPIVLKKS